MNCALFQLLEEIIITCIVEKSTISVSEKIIWWYLSVSLYLCLFHCKYHTGQFWVVFIIMPFYFVQPHHFVVQPEIHWGKLLWSLIYLNILNLVLYLIVSLIVPSHCKVAFLLSVDGCRKRCNVQLGRVDQSHRHFSPCPIV